MKRGKPMKRGGRVNPVNEERRARERAETDGPCAAMARTLPCLLAGTRYPTRCIGDTDPDHVRTRGARGKDWANVVPLCRGHHTERHQAGVATFAKRYGLDLEREAQLVADRVKARDLAPALARMGCRGCAPGGGHSAACGQTPASVARPDPVELVAAVLWLRSVNATVSFDARGGVTVRATGIARRRATLLEAVGAARAGATVAGIRRSLARIRRGPSGG